MKNRKCGTFNESDWKGKIKKRENYYNNNGVPTGIRTPVTAVKGRCPRPLDDRDVVRCAYHIELLQQCQIYFRLLTELSSSSIIVFSQDILNVLHAFARGHCDTLILRRDCRLICFWINIKGLAMCRDFMH